MGARRGGGPEGWGPEPRKGGARRVGDPKFRAFFSLPPEISFFLLSLGSSRGILAKTYAYLFYFLEVFFKSKKNKFKIQKKKKQDLLLQLFPCDYALFFFSWNFGGV